MNSGKIMKELKHIDPREPIKRQPITNEAIELSAMMHASDTTPYRYIRRGLDCLVKGDFSQACSWLDHAESFIGVFWPARSEDDTAYKMCIHTLRVHFLFLGEKFKELKPED